MSVHGELRQLLLEYALHGQEQWVEKRDQAARTAAQRCLGGRVADEGWLVSDTIDKGLSGSALTNLKFLPMPQSRATADITWAFFVPVGSGTGDTFRVRFDLFLLIASYGLSFRFEPAAGAASSHDYGHVQLNRRPLQRNVPSPCTLNWVPESYPAFPLPTSEPIEMFLCLATAVHGRGKDGVGDVLRQIFTSIEAASRVRTYEAKLTPILR